MNIVFDNIIYNLQRSGGISVYWKEIISRFQKKDFKIKFYHYNNSNYFGININNDLILNSNKSISFIKKYLNINSKINNKYIFHSSYYRVDNNKNAINIITVHDFTHEKFFTFPKNYLMKIYKYKALKRANGIICVSKNTKKDLLSLYPNLKNKKIKVIYNGIDNVYKKVNNFPLSIKNKFSSIFNNKFLLFVGSRSNYKNFNFVIDLIKKLPNFKLFVVGNKFNESELEIINGILPRVKVFSSISNTELNYFYNKAYSLIYPSSYEGFGIPIIEAMRSKCPVLTLENPSSIEIAKKYSLMCKKLDVNEFIKSINKLQNEDKRNKIIEDAYDYSKNYSWNKCIDETENFYNSMDKK